MLEQNFRGHDAILRAGDDVRQDCLVLRGVVFAIDKQRVFEIAECLVEGLRGGHRLCRVRDAVDHENYCAGHVQLILRGSWIIP